MSEQDNDADFSGRDDTSRNPTIRAGAGGLPPGNIWLTGLMGCGKTTAGWHLAQFCGLGYIDLDAWIEMKAGRKTHEIFAQQGEEGFRRWEAKGVRYWGQAKRFVIALGGGALVAEPNWSAVRASGLLVWLKPPLQELGRRLLAAPEQLALRPLLAELLHIDDKEKQAKLMTERLGVLMSQRQDRYKAAEIIVDNGYTPPDVTARCIKELLMQEGYFGTGETKLSKNASRWKRWGTI